jgi:SlyX protein
MGDIDLEARIVELEIRHTEQAELLTQLSDVLVGQQRAIDELNREVHGLRQRLAAEPGLVDAQDRERPPHY